jgi:hypothetical protein
LIDLLFALALVICGFCFWEWGVLDSSFDGGAGTTVFFLLAIVVSFVYLRLRGIRQNAKSLLLLLAALAGALPFVLYGPRDVNGLLLLFEACACLLWVMYSCRTSIVDKVSGLVAGDLLNQVFIVPFANFGALFVQPFRQGTSSGEEGGRQGGSEQTGGRKAGGRKTLSSLLFAALGIVVCIPVFGLVVWLLAASDAGFRQLGKTLIDLLDFDHVIRYAVNVVLGIPVAAYVFGAVFGNVARRHTSLVGAAGTLRAFEAAHALPRALFVAPLALFGLLYLVYFLAMGSYLFSGLRGELPVAFTYAEYARSGFFELCAVAAINLAVLAGVWLLARREARERPPALRLLSGLLALLTCLLIVAAASKMLLYVGTYGLTPLRLYTTWFMAFLLLLFLALVVWHLKPYNAARPIVVLAVVFTLGLGLVNTNGLIADYNVGRYLTGQTEKIDVETLADLGEPALPALRALEDGSEDPQVREEAIQTSADIRREAQLRHLAWPQWSLQAP